MEDDSSGQGSQHTQQGNIQVWQLTVARQNLNDTHSARTSDMKRNTQLSNHNANLYHYCTHLPAALWPRPNANGRYAECLCHCCCNGRRHTLQHNRKAAAVLKGFCLVDHTHCLASYLRLRPEATCRNNKAAPTVKTRHSVVLQGEMYGSNSRGGSSTVRQRRQSRRAR